MIRVLAAVLLAAATTSASDQAAHYFTNVELVTQNGDTVRLYDDLMRGKVVVISPFFSTCRASCPLMSATLAAVQNRFRDRVGKDLVIISISVDPEDTPEKLKKAAAQFGAQPGWYFITGRPANIELALRKFGQYVEKPSDHANLILIGNDRTGLWKKVFGLAPKDDVLKVVQSVLDDGK